MARGYGEPVGNEYGADENRERWHDRDRERSSYGRDRDEDRGFFERAGDEIRSWFSDDDDDRRSGRDYEHGRSSDWTGRSSWDRERSGRSGSPGGGWTGGSSWDRDQDRGSISDRDRERSYGRIGRSGSDYMNENRSSFGGMAQGGRERERERGLGSSRAGYWSESGTRDRSGKSGYGESQLGGQERQGLGRRERGFGEGRHAQSWDEANRGQGGLDRDRGESHTGYSDFGDTLGGFGNQRFGSSQDDHYRSWRDRQMQQLDRDYGDYCREREQQFHSDFDSWRRNRQSQPGQGTGDELTLGSSSATSGRAGMGSATGSSGESSAIGGDTLTGSSPTQSDATAGNETPGSGSGVSGRSRTRS